MDRTEITAPQPPLAALAPQEERRAIRRRWRRILLAATISVLIGIGIGLAISDDRLHAGSAAAATIARPAPVTGR